VPNNPAPAGRGCDRPAEVREWSRMVLNRASSAEGSVGHCHPAEWDPRGKRRTIGYGPAWAGREDGCP